MKTEADYLRLDDATEEDYKVAPPILAGMRKEEYKRVMGLLRRLDEPAHGHRLNFLEHSLQTATRAYKDGADEELTICALFHDIGHYLSSYNHGSVVAEMLRPYICEQNYWLLKHHTVFQLYHLKRLDEATQNSREKYRGSPHFQITADFCARWDSTAFDPDYKNMPLEAFEPMVKRVFETPRLMGM